MNTRQQTKRQKKTHPTDNLYLSVNQKWLETTQIPDEYTEWNNFLVLHDKTFHDLKSILDSLLEDSSAESSHNEQLIKRLYSSGIRTEKLNTNVLTRYLGKIQDIKYKFQLPGLMSKLANIGVPSFFDVEAEVDSKDSTTMIPFIWQSGLSLPDRDYYFLEDKKEIIIKFKQHINKMAQILHLNLSADSILDIETRLAEHHMTQTELRDPVKIYNKLTYAQLKVLCPNFEWDYYFFHPANPVISLPTEDLYFVTNSPKYLEVAAKLLSEIPLDQWKDYYQWRVITSLAPFLPQELEEEHFNFFRKTLLGQKEQKPRWKRLLAMIDKYLGQAMGQIYAKKYFPESSKEKMMELIDNLMVSMRERIQELDWMSDQTKSQALEKLSKIRVKVGYPDKWIDYTNLDFELSDSFLEQIIKVRTFEKRRDQNKWYQPVDREEWFTLPQTVNAYYDAELNEIIFPAAILQPPFFDPQQDPVESYGAIGAVIGHEITHAFDDEGRQYDAHGNLRDWWTPEDAQKFEEKAQVLVEQYSQCQILGQSLNGKLTLGENIADIGGVKIAYYAYQNYLQKNRKKFTTALQKRFFIAWARAWRNHIRKEEALDRVVTDPHSPPEYRVNLVVSNLKEFAQTFRLKPGDGLYNSRATSIW